MYCLVYTATSDCMVDLMSVVRVKQSRREIVGKIRAWCITRLSISSTIENDRHSSLLHCIKTNPSLSSLIFVRKFLTGKIHSKLVEKKACATAPWIIIAELWLFQVRTASKPVFDNFSQKSFVYSRELVKRSLFLRANRSRDFVWLLSNMVGIAVIPKKISVPVISSPCE